MTCIFTPVKTFPGTSEIINCISYEQPHRYFVKLAVVAPYINSHIQSLIEEANIEGVYFSMHSSELIRYSNYLSFVHFEADKAGFIDVLKFLNNHDLITNSDLRTMRMDLGVDVHLDDTDSELESDSDSDTLSDTYSDDMDIPGQSPRIGL